MVIETELIKEQNIWFISYGENNGMNKYDYHFVIQNDNNTILK